MIQDQASTSYNYHPSRVNFFNITANRVDPPEDSHRSEFSDPHSNLQYIGRSLQKFSEEQLIGLPYRSWQQGRVANGGKKKKASQAK